MMQRALLPCLFALILALPIHAEDGPGVGEAPGAIKEIGGLNFAWCPEGAYLMGSPVDTQQLAENYGGRPEWYEDEVPQREVKVAGYWMSQREVTRAEWVALMNTRPWGDQAGEDDALPATGITWEEARDFAREFAKRHNCNARLPLESEWEYACRAGSVDAFPFGVAPDQLLLFAQYRLNAPGGLPQPVGQRGANAWGLHDMLGNAWEWCQDKYGALDDSGSASFRVMRGGAANSTAAFLRCSYRTGVPIETRSPRLGMRLLVEP